MVFAKLLLILTSAVTANGDAQLLCFEASWCEPCRTMQPTLDRLALEGFPIRRVDVDQYGALAKRYQISAVPACVLVDDRGYKMDQITQATDYQTLRRFLAHHRITPAPTTVRGQSPVMIENPRANLSTSLPPIVHPPAPSQPGLRQPRPQQPNPLQPRQGAATSNLDSVQSGSLASSIRLRVEDAGGHSFGTGTVIDVHGQEALVLTCGHIFRESKGQGRILMQRFDSATVEPTTGTLISYDIDRDVALVSMKLTRPIEIARLAPPERKVRPGDTVYSIGCNQGANPSIVNGRVNRIDKYLGPPNITASGRPVLGRSGGGLFNAQGELIGVCSAADPEIDEGLYAALPRVYDELNRNGLAFIYQAPAQEPLAQVASTGDVPNLANPPATNLQAPVAASVGLVPKPNAAGQNSPAATRSNDRELICVLKSGNGTQIRAYVIEKPSDELLEQLRRESKLDGR